MKIEKQLTKKMEQMFQNDLRFTKGASHCHTQNSEDDGFSSEYAMCAVPQSLGAEKVFISDHGTAQGWDDFDDAAKKLGITPIFGVEGYFLDDVLNMYPHIVLYAKNEEGMRQICKALSRATILEDGRHVFPIETLQMLRGGNIIATSACISGVFGAIVLHNDRIKNKIAKLNAEIAEFDGAIAAYNAAEKQYSAADAKFSVLRAEVADAKAASKKSFSSKQKQVESLQKKLEKAQAAFDKFLEDGKESSAKSVRVALSNFEIAVEDPDDFQMAIDEARMKLNQRAAQIKAEIAQTEAVAATLNAKTIAMEAAKVEKAEAKKVLDATSKDVAKVETRQVKIAELEEQMLSKEASQELFERRFSEMLDIFGDDFYMEVQNHGLELEAKIYPWLASVARKRGIKLIAANDAHMATNSEDDIAGRQIRRSCRFQKWEELSEDLGEYYIKTDRELALALYQILPEDVVIEAMRNVASVVDQCNASIVKGSHAPKAKGCENAKDEIIRICRANIPKKIGDGWNNEYEERFNFELGIIDKMGFNDYFIITCNILYVARLTGGLSYEKLDELKSVMNDMTLDELMAFIKKNNTEPNISVGLGRGSGAGSLVCYLLGITNINPFKYDLLFERFLNPERISMPDIDSDFRTDIKDVLLVYLKKKYGDRAIAQILTKSYLQGKSAIDKVVMILGSRDTIERERRFKNGETMRPGELKTNANGSLSVVPVDYRYIADRLKKKTGVDFTKSMAENRDALLAGADSAIEKEIVDLAIIMDNNMDHTGLHAAGVIISDNDDLAEYIPVAWDVGFETWKTQCNMVQCEEKHGLLKMDLLLLKTLDIITYTLRLIKQNHPDVVIDIDNLPHEEEVFKKIYARGDTKAVFQFESGGMIKFLRQMQPSCIEDIIAANALYRPGPMDYIPDYVQAKHSGNVVYDCPELEPILKGTYGIIVYQEQVQRIVRDLAGYSLGRADLVRRAMSKKKHDVLDAERQNFVYGNEAEGIIGCVKNGISADVANKIFDKMIAFAAYAFNKSHAAVYSETSYMTAWLKYHYPTEFFCAALNFVGAQKEIPSLIADAKKHHIAILPPDVNKSEANFSTENGNVRFGLKFLANAKTRASAMVDARESGYKTFKEFVQAKPGKAMAEACIWSGACDSLIGNDPERRNSAWMSYEMLSTLYDNILNAQSRVEAATKDDVKQKAEMALDALVQQWELFDLLDIAALPLMERLDKEQQYTSVYFSADPLDGFTIDADYKEIESLEDGESAWIAASLSDKKILKTKRDALPMMSGRLTDRSGTVACIVFPKNYAQIANKLDNVMAFYGKLTSNNDEEAQFVISDVKPLPQKSKRMVVWFDDYNATKDTVRKGSVNRSTGMEVWLTGKNAKMYRTGIYITEDYAKQSGLRYKITD